MLSRVRMVLCNPDALQHLDGPLLPAFTFCSALLPCHPATQWSIAACSVSEVAFIGNSLLEGCSGHNLAEAAVAGCAVLIGEHAGHFSTMADELNQAAVSA
jgi:hypothetical protein